MTGQGCRQDFNLNKGSKHNQKHLEDKEQVQAAFTILGIAPHACHEGEFGILSAKPWCLQAFVPFAYFFLLHFIILRVKTLIFNVLRMRTVMFVFTYLALKLTISQKCSWRQIRHPRSYHLLTSFSLFSCDSLSLSVSVIRSLALAQSAKTW